MQIITIPSAETNRTTDSQDASNGAVSSQDSRRTDTHMEQKQNRKVGIKFLIITSLHRGIELR